MISSITGFVICAFRPGFVFSRLLVFRLAECPRGFDLEFFVVRFISPPDIRLQLQSQALLRAPRGVIRHLLYGNGALAAGVSAN